MILIFLREFTIVMTGFATVDSQRQPLLITGVRFAQVIQLRGSSKVLQVERSLMNSLNSIRIKFRFKALFKFGVVSTNTAVYLNTLVSTTSSINL